MKRVITLFLLSSFSLFCMEEQSINKYNSTKNFDQSASKTLFDKFCELKFNQMEDLIKQKADPNYKNEYGTTPLIMAIIIKDDLTWVSYLLKHGANVNAQTINNFTPLHAAMAATNEKAIKLLLNKGANPLLLDNEGNSPLHFALTNYPEQKNKSKIIETLIKHSSDPKSLVNQKNNEDKTAIELTNDEQLKKLLASFNK